MTDGKDRSKREGFDLGGFLHEVRRAARPIVDSVPPPRPPTAKSRAELRADRLRELYNRSPEVESTGDRPRRTIVAGVHRRRGDDRV